MPKKKECEKRTFVLGRLVQERWLIFQLFINRENIARNGRKLEKKKAVTKLRARHEKTNEGVVRTISEAALTLSTAPTGSVRLRIISGRD
jgi:hypothetical protein